MESKRILVVDDTKEDLELLAAMVDALGHAPELATDGIEALAKVRLDIDLVLLDVAMPGMDGFAVARRIREDPEHGDTPIIMVTGMTARDERLRAVEAGANDFIAKPFDLTEVRVRTTPLLKRKEIQDAMKRHQETLGNTVRRRTEDLRRALQEMTEAQRRAHEAHLSTIRRLALAAEYRDNETGAHIERMSEYSAILARRLRLPPGEVDIIRAASAMHDVGKIGIPDRILLKQGPLNDEEWEAMRTHTLIGAGILGGSASELLQAGEVIALSHHERWDGTGYPNGLKGESIPLWGRICAVADVFDALTSARPYKDAFSNEAAVAILRDGRGSQFEPRLVDLFVEDLGEIVAVQQRFHDDLPPEARDDRLPRISLLR